MTALATVVGHGLLRLPTHQAAYLGTGAVSRLEQALTARGVSRVLFVHGRTSYERSGAADVVRQLPAWFRTDYFDGVRPNPGVEQVRSGVAAARRFGPDVVVGIGGGSALDVAKAVAVLSVQRADPASCVRDPALITARRTAALVLMPTTAGSGSEMTRFATIYVDGVKHSVDLDQMRADVVLVDPALCSSLSVGHAVAGGLDALCHAVESLWSVAAAKRSRELAWAALTHLLPALSAATGHGRHTGPGVLDDMCLGASLAGAAIDLTRTTAAHALSYPLTARLGLPHGVAVAVHLRWLLSRHAVIADRECRHPEGAAAVRQYVADVQRLARDTHGDDLEHLISGLLAQAGQPTDIQDLRLAENPWRHEFAGALHSRRGDNNPCVLTDADVRKLFA
jgi:alcohol dehydrogenase class IV